MGNNTAAEAESSPVWAGYALPLSSHFLHHSITTCFFPAVASRFYTMCVSWSHFVKSSSVEVIPLECPFWNRTMPFYFLNVCCTHVRNWKLAIQWHKRIISSASGYSFICINNKITSFLSCLSVPGLVVFYLIIDKCYCTLCQHSFFNQSITFRCTLEISHPSSQFPLH